MKILLSILFLHFGAACFSQTLDGINAEHLVVNPPSHFPAQTTGFTVQRIELSTGVTLEYVEQGNATGIPVIFLHGITDSWHSFETTLPHLPSSIHAFALTQRGHGNSDKPVEGYTPKHFAADVAAFIRQKGLSKVIVVGHSMGGVNAQQFALDYPHLAKAIVIVDSDASFKTNPGMEDFYKEVMRMEGTLSRDFMNEFQKGTLAKPIDSVYFKLLVDEGLKTPARVFKAAFAGLISIDFIPQLKNIKCPALVVWGDRDAFCLRDGQVRLATGIKNARLLVYKGIGHALHWEEPKRFAADLSRFIHSVHTKHHEAKTKK